MGLFFPLMAGGLQPELRARDSRLPGTAERLHGIAGTLADITHAENEVY